jgi:hypothetical protein
MRGFSTSPEDFRKRLGEVDARAIFEEFILAKGAAHVSHDGISQIAQKVGASFATPVDTIFIRIVGSAKLGFSLLEKKERNGAMLPRYRLFSSDSDIDVAVVCPRIFNQIWYELSRYTRMALYPHLGNPTGSAIISSAAGFGQITFRSRPD